LPSNLNVVVPLGVVILVNVPGPTAEATPAAASSVPAATADATDKRIARVNIKAS
jgi:hypothetical protein